MSDLPVDLVPGLPGHVGWHKALHHAKNALPINPQDPLYGVTFDGVTDDTDSWNDIFASMGATGGLILCPAGTSLNRGPWNPPANVTIVGAGMGRTVIKFKNATAILGGLVCASNLTVRDLTLQADVNGQTWCATHIYSQACSGVLFDHVEFKGTTTKVGNWAGWVSHANASNVRYRDCKYELVEFGIAKDNGDASVQENWHWQGGSANNCTDVHNINSPLGSWAHGSIKGFHYTNISQFPVAFAGPHCAHWDIEIQGQDNELELVHIEAGARDIDVHVSGYLCNKTPGVVGSPGAVNGMVQCITGAHDVRITGFMDLTANMGGSPNGVVVQPGGGDPCYAISVAAHIKAKAGCRAVFAQNVGLDDPGSLDLSDCIFENDPAAKSEKMLEILTSVISGGNNRFINPGVVLHAEDNSYGGLQDSTFLGDLSTLDFLAGVTNSGTSVVFQNFKLRRPFTVDPTAAWQDICPDGSLYDGFASIRYVGNGAGDSFTKTARLTGDSGVVTVGAEQANTSGGVDPNPGAPHFRSSGGNLQTKCYRGSAQTGTILFTFQGAWFG